MKDALKSQVRSVLFQIANSLPNGREGDGTINLPAVLHAVNSVASEYYTEQKCDSAVIGAVVDGLLAKYPTLGKGSVAAMAAKELTKGEDPSVFPATMRRVSEFVESAYTVKRGKVVVNTVAAPVRR